MKFVSLSILMLVTAFANGQNKISPYITEGYFNDFVRETRSQITVSGGNANGIARISLEKASEIGYYTGLGFNTQFPSSIGIQLEAVYERHSLTTNSTYYDSSQFGVHNYQGNDNEKSSYVKVAPSVIYNKFKQHGFSYFGELGLSYSILIADQYRFRDNYTAGHIAFGAGYSGILLRIGYEYGLSGMFKGQAELYANTNYWQIKSSRINIGVTFYPTVFFKG